VVADAEIVRFGLCGVPPAADVSIFVAGWRTLLSRWSRYDCEDAVAMLRTLPEHHFHTGWVQCLIGKAYFEITDYKLANQAYRMARRIEFVTSPASRPGFFVGFFVGSSFLVLLCSFRWFLRLLVSPRF
jgi:hypothetical protein